MSESAKPSRRLFLAAGPAAAVSARSAPPLRLPLRRTSPWTMSRSWPQSPVTKRPKGHIPTRSAPSTRLPPDWKVARSRKPTLISGLRSGARRRGGGGRGVARNRSPGLGVRCALAYLAEMQDGYHLRDFIPTLLESPLLAGAGES